MAKGITVAACIGIMVGVLLGKALVASVHPHRPASIPPELRAFVRLYESEKGDVVNPNVAFEFVDEITNLDGSIAPDAVGSCEHDSRYGTVQILRSAWDKMEEQRRMLLFFHELGHCDLNLRHSSEGIMAPVLATDVLSPLELKQRLEELFQHQTHGEVTQAIDGQHASQLAKSIAFAEDLSEDEPVHISGSVKCTVANGATMYCTNKPPVGDN